MDDDFSKYVRGAPPEDNLDENRKAKYRRWAYDTAKASMRAAIEGNDTKAKMLHAVSCEYSRQAGDIDSWDPAEVASSSHLRVIKGGKNGD